MTTDILTQINYFQQKLNKLAEQKADPLKDPEIYEISCILDQLIVDYMKSQKTII